MRRWLLALVMLLAPVVAQAQNTPPLIFSKGDPTHLAISSNQDVYTGIYFPGPQQMCFAVAGVSIGCNLTGGGGGSPPGINGQLIYNNNGAYGAFTLSGDCTIAVPAITCTKTGGNPFSAFATANPASPPAIGGTTPNAGAFTTLAASSLASAGTQCVQVSSAGVFSGTGSPCSGSSGSSAFSAITSGTNTAATMTVSTGASLTFSGSGSINASQLQGSTWAAPQAIGTTTPAGATFSTLTLQNITGSVQCVRASALGTLSGTGTDCNTLNWASVGSGTNTTATMTVGTGATLTFSGSGVLNASQLLGGTWASPGIIGATVPNAGIFSNITDSALTGTAQNCLYADTNGKFHGSGTPCGTGGGGGSGTVNAGLASQVAFYPVNGSQVSGATTNGGCANLNMNASNSTLGVVFPVEAVLGSNYALQAGDMGCTIPFVGSGITVTIPATGVGTSILAPGQAVTLLNTNPRTSVYWSYAVNITNASSATMEPNIFDIGPGESITLQGIDSGHIAAYVSSPFGGGQGANAPAIFPWGINAYKSAEEHIYYSEPGTSCYLLNTPAQINSPVSGTCGTESQGACNSVIVFTSATAVSVDPTLTLDAGCEVTLIQGGAGKVSVVDSGDTIVNAGSGVGTRTTGSVMKIWGTGGTTVYLSGDTS